MSDVSDICFVLCSNLFILHSPSLLWENSHLCWAHLFFQNPSLLWESSQLCCAHLFFRTRACSGRILQCDQYIYFSEPELALEEFSIVLCTVIFQSPSLLWENSHLCCAQLFFRTRACCWRNHSYSENSLYLHILFLFQCPSLLWEYFCVKKWNWCLPQYKSGR